MNTTLSLGTAKIEITPEKPVPLAGFAARKGLPFEGILHPLYARIFYFQQEEKDGRKTVSLMVSADLLCWGQERVQPIKEKISKRFGVEEHYIILHATHTHSGPMTGNRQLKSVGVSDSDYIEMLENRVLQGIERAKQCLEPVVIERGHGECRIGIHRRIRSGGKAIMGPNKEGPVDPEVSVIRFTKASGGTKAVLVHYTCHTTTSGENRVSSEFAGVAMEQLEEFLGDEAVAGYLQGCCGDVRPALIREGKFYTGGKREILQFGSHLAEEVIRVMDTSMKRINSSFLKSTSVTIDLPHQAIPDITSLMNKTWPAFADKDKRQIVADWSEMLIQHPDRLKKHTKLDLTLFQLAEDFSFLSMNGEAVVQYGLFTKHISGGRVLPIAYSNGMIGYIPTSDQIAEGGYEAADSIYYFGLPAPFSHDIEEVIKETIKKLILAKGN